jgi:lysophospholipase L1-like esterase
MESLGKIGRSSMAHETVSNETAVPARATKSRRIRLFRAGAILFGLSILAIFEAICRFNGWGAPENQDDPYVGFAAVHPLFVKDASSGKFVTATSRLKYFATESFPIEKPPGTFRVFCIGGSTVQGRPYSTATSFPTWMKLGLAEADPSRTWEVINCGGISYATYRLVPILEECLNYEPDLIILCEGHNEFLEDRTYESLKQSSAAAKWGREAMGRSHIATLLRELFSNGFSEPKAPANLLPNDADALLNYKNGLRAYHRDPEWRAGVVQHFELNLNRMIRLCRAHDTPVLVVLPPSNLADCAPFKSEHKEGLSESDRDTWNRLRESVHEASRKDVPTAIAHLKEMLAIDPEYAATHYELGKCYEATGLHRDARAAYVTARDLDICPLRMISELEMAMRRVVAELDVPFLDAHALLEARSRHGILAGPILCDRVHPSFEGHQWIADELIRRMAELGCLNPSSGWESRAKKSYDHHFAEIDARYFLNGQRTLESVERWTRGETDGPPIETRAPHRLRADD